MSMTTTRLGPLTCRIVSWDSGARATLACVLCHGYGAPGTDLVGLAEELVARAPSLRGAVRFVFPEAPLALDHVPFGGRAWWEIDLDRLARMQRETDRAAWFDNIPEGLPTARKALMAALDALCLQEGLPWGALVLGGFSQGAMLATDVALRLDEAPAALAILSGTLICRAEWQRLAPRRRGLPTLIAHGSHDPLLPLAAAEALRDLLAGAGLDVGFTRFAGGHGIDGNVLHALAQVLGDALATRTAR